MTRTQLALATALSCALALPASPLLAQDDRAAGLFTEARDLLLVSQSLVVHVTDQEAVLELVQVFANDGPDLGQADYRLPLPEHATVLGYGFWQDDEFLAAELKGKQQAIAAHQKAASEGRPTALSRRYGGRVQSFSVFPVQAGELKQVEITLQMPVVTEDGRSHLRLPIEHFLGRSPVTSTVVVHLDTAEPIQDLGVTPVLDKDAFQLTHLESRAATLTLAVDRAFEVWWAEKMPAFLARADAVAVEEGRLAWQLRLAFRDDSPNPDDELVVLVDGSKSLRRRGSVVSGVVERLLERAPGTVRVVEVGVDVRQLGHRPPGGSAEPILAELARGVPTFGLSWEHLTAAAVEEGCELGGWRRCVAITDPQALGSANARGASFVPLFLGDANELAYFSGQLGPEALSWDTGAETRGKLWALVDELVRPLLVVERIDQRGGTLEVLTGQRQQVAAGGYLRLAGFTYSQEPFDIELSLAGESRSVRVEPTLLLPDDPRAASVRRQAYGMQLDDWMRQYRQSREPELKQRIVELSVREGIPTQVTAFHVASPDVLPSGGTPAELLRRFGLLLLAVGLAFAAAGRRP
ncbi:MAG: VIT domain-containing protein [Acidobacteriota bacterium]